MTKNDLHQTACLCVFARAPVAGKVKTRLLPLMDAESACQLHQYLIDDSLSRVVNNDLWQTRLWGTDIKDAFLTAMSKQYAISLHEQQGNGLGARMAHAAKITLQDYQYVILIGTDCPELDVKYINDVLQKMQSGVDCVLGPAEDGGYVMLALSMYDDSLFSDIEWGTDQVLADTRKKINALNWQCHEMPELWDVDRPADVDRLKNYF